jgi:hypothetical protein
MQFTTFAYVAASFQSSGPEQDGANLRECEEVFFLGERHATMPRPPRGGEQQ